MSDRSRLALFHRIFSAVSPYFRRKRMERFVAALGVTAETRILDVGGTWANWDLLATKPEVWVLNLYEGPADHPNADRWIVGDGLALPFEDDSFDIAFSNSVIEHLANSTNQQRFANELRRVAQRYYVQTPNKHFPIEPHLLTPLIHYLPERWQARLLRNGTVWGLLLRPSVESCNFYLTTTRLLGHKEFHALFDYQGSIWKERFMGLVKSFVIVGP